MTVGCIYYSEVENDGHFDSTVLLPQPLLVILGTVSQNLLRDYLQNKAVTDSIMNKSLTTTQLLSFE